MYLVRNQDFRVIRSGRVLEVLKYKALVRPVQNFSDSSPTARRRSLKLRRTISSNAGCWYRSDGRSFLPLFMTLTFALDVSPVYAKRAIYLFYKRVNYAVFGTKSSQLKYSYVIELTKIGRPHFHVILYNLPFIPDFKRKFERWWSHGYVRINSVRDVRNVGAYVVKYMSKDFHRTDIGARMRLYSNAQKLLRPLVYEGDDARWFVHRLETESPWLYERKLVLDYSIYYLGEGSLPSVLAPPVRSPAWLLGHND